jgi:chitodextrinase
MKLRTLVALLLILSSTAAIAGVSCFFCDKSRTTQYMLYFTNDTATTAFLASQGGANPAGIAYIAPYDMVTQGPILAAAGYKMQTVLPSYSFNWVQGDSGSGNIANLYAKIQAEIDAGATLIWVNEPNPKVLTTSPLTYYDLNDPISIAYNTAGSNLIYAYIKAHTPPGKTIEYGISFPSIKSQLLMLQAGANLDFAQIEVYNGEINSAYSKQNPFVVSGLTTQFPNVKTSALVYASRYPICGNGGENWLSDGQLDYIEIWDANLDAAYIHPMMDPNVIANTLTMSSTKKKTFCNLPWSYVPNYEWGTVLPTAPSFSLAIADVYNMSNGGAAPGPVSNCQYKIMSGAYAHFGPTDPSLVTTRDWTNRACNSNISITVGLGRDCRDIGSYTCQIWLRGTDANNTPDNLSYHTFNIAFDVSTPQSLEAPLFSGYPQSATYVPIALWWQDLGTTIPNYSSFLNAMNGIGMNTLISLNGASGGMWTPSSFGQDSSGYFDQIAAAGIRLIPQVNSTTGPCNSPSTTGNLTPNNTDACSVASYQALMTAKSNQNTIIGYQVVDEPQTGSCTQYPMSGIPGQLAVYKGYDPTRPFFMNSTPYVTNGGTCSPTTLNTNYMAAVSIGSFDTYPLVNPNLPAFIGATPSTTVPIDGLWIQGYIINQMMAVRAKGAPFWAWVDSGSDVLINFASWSYTCNPSTNICTDGTYAIWNRAPANLVNAEVWMSIINGATGIEYFCQDTTVGFAYCMGQGGSAGALAAQANITYINSNINSFAQVINSLTAGKCSMITGSSYNSYTTSCSDNNLTVSTGTSTVPASAILKLSNGATYLIAQTAHKGSSALTFTAAGLAGKTATVVYDSNSHYDSAHTSLGSTFTLNGSAQFTDTLGANGDDYQVKIYQINGAVTVDLIPPTTPTNLYANSVSTTEIDLTWTASTDNVAVTGYNIYRNGVKIGTSATNSFNNTGLTPSTAYTYNIQAYDAAGNTSAQSSNGASTTLTPTDIAMKWSLTEQTTSWFNQAVNTLNIGSTNANGTCGAIAAGELLVATETIWTNGAGDPGTLSTPTGWTQAWQNVQTDLRTAVFYKIATGSESCSFASSWTSTASEVGWTLTDFTYPGTTPSSVIDVASSQGIPGSSATTGNMVANSVTTTHANDMLFAVYTTGTVNGPYTAPSGMTKIADFTGVAYPPTGIFIAWKILGAAGATGNETAIMSSAFQNQINGLVAFNKN